MSGDHAKKEMVTGEKPTTSHGKAPSGESYNKGKGKEKESPSHKSRRSGDKKKMRKVVYYETDSSSPSTSGSDTPSVTSKRHERKKFSKIPLRYPSIPKLTPLLSIPLGKPPTFDGEDYARWSDMMRYHLTSDLKMRKVVYYETDSSSPSTSGSDTPSVTSKRHERKKFSKIPLRYPSIPKLTPLLSIPLGKPPTFDGEDYARWSDMMRYHLT